MPVQKTQTYANNVYNTLKMLKGDDGRISSKEEANAVLEYYQSLNVKELSKIDQERLMWACHSAQTFIDYGDTSLLYATTQLLKCLKKNGLELYKKIAQKFNGNEKFVSQKANEAKD